MFSDTEPRKWFHYVLLVLILLQLTVYSERMWKELAIQDNGKAKMVANVLRNTNLHKISEFKLKIFQLEQRMCAYLRDFIYCINIQGLEEKVEAVLSSVANLGAKMIQWSDLFNYLCKSSKRIFAN